LAKLFLDDIMYKQSAKQTVSTMCRLMNENNDKGIKEIVEVQVDEL